MKKSNLLVIGSGILTIIAGLISNLGEENLVNELVDKRLEERLGKEEDEEPD